jgi:DNA helicase II / ATP-dependent DNA helicase PcrA
MNLLDDLNPQQREAVLATEGPLLVLAGAGTGKTRVITYRIANLIQQGVPGGSILAVTFTNKAAEQMRSRVQTLLDHTGGSAGDPWISTFHAFCARLLRREAPRLGLSRDFAIYDDDDQRAAIKLAQNALASADSEDDADDKPRDLLSRISYWKNQGTTIEEALAAADDPRARIFARTYEAYERVLHKSGALDFDDLLLRAAEVLRRFDDARAHWQQRFRYLHVDEYQDTNRVQHSLLRLLAGETPNLCVVGDEDQSIYRWRGADSGTILRFSQDYPGAKIFRIEQNYRSRQAILDAAAAVVAHNGGRIGKQLQATRGQGGNLTFFEARDAHAESEWIAERIAQLQREDSSAHIAVIYRTNAQSRSFEESFRARGWRYRLLGGFSFYQRAEVKDALAYVRLAMFPDDDIALLRVLNTPPRGIGKTSIEALQTVARGDGSSLWTALGKMVESGAGRALAPLRGFRELIEDLRAKYAELPPHQFMAAVLELTGYLEMLRQRHAAEDTSRIENLRELVNAVAEGDERGETLADFLDHASLVSGADSFDERATITLLTLHTAKGLEFEHVFLSGLEEGTFPHSRSLDDTAEIEEERRLCYVGMTRARETLALTRAVYRRSFGSERLQASLPSRFLAEIPGELIDTASGSLADAGQQRRYEPDPEYSYSRDEFERRIRGQKAPAPTRSQPVRAARPSFARPKKGAANPLIGQLVRHPSYGLGTIIMVEGDEDGDRKLTVSFSGHGTKKLVERFANLSWA